MIVCLFPKLTYLCEKLFFSYMKFLFAVLFFAISCFQLQAQVRLGISGGTTLNKVSLEGIDASVENYTGWYVGPTLEIGLPVLGLKVDGALQYYKNGATVEGVKYSSDYVSLPLNLKLVLGSSSVAAIYLSAGPQFDFSLKDKMWDFPYFDHTLKQFSLRSSQLSINLGAGVRLLKHLQAGIYYNVACGDTAEYNDEVLKNLSFRNNMWKVNAVYFF